MKWTEVQIKTTKELEEKVSNILYDLGVQGLAIEDPNDILEFIKNEEDWDLVDSKLIDKDFDTVIIKCYFPESEDLIDKIDLIRQSIERKYSKQSLGKVTISEVYEKDWAEGWKKYYKPIKVGNRVVIKPSWEDYKAIGDDIVIELDPGMAFGTGTHETTILCIKKLERHVEKGDTVFDIGCGSGILSIVAAKLKAEKVLGVDLDDMAVKVAKENVAANKVDNIVEIKKSNLLNIVEGKADIIVSNILAEVIVDLTKSVGKHLNNKGLFISSGIIEEKENMVKEVLESNNFTVLETNSINGWVSIVSRYEKDESNE